MNRRRASASIGLSLIELVVAMALFALVAVMGAQALTGMLRLRDGLEHRSSQSGQLALATSLLRADLRDAVPMLFYPPVNGAPHSAARSGDVYFHLSIAGQSALPGPAAAPVASQFHRVEWRLDRTTGQLYRRSWRSLYPAGRDALTPEVAVLDHVAALDLRSYWPTIGWQPGVTQLAPPQTSNQHGDSDTTSGPPEVFSSQLPEAIEITLELETLGRITLLESFR